MITAVALPRILADITDWTQLRRASWIVNGYLLSYIATMPLAGRAADRFGLPALTGIALGIFGIGSLLAGAAQDLDQLIAARVLQGIGGGAIVPLATAGASHLYSGAARARALGIVGALTFLGMAIGPFAGATVLEGLELGPGLRAAGLEGSLSYALAAPAWRWIFYLNIPIGLCGLALAWAASAGWETSRRAGRVDWIGAAVFGLALGSGLIALTLIGAGQVAGSSLDPRLVTAALAAVAVVATLLSVLRAARAGRAGDAFLEIGLFRHRAFSAAALVSLLTGYAFATAIIGGAVFVDRVLYGGPDQQRLALGALAAATALGALASGFLVRVASYRIVTLAGLGLSVLALARMAGWTAGTDISAAALDLAAFGLGFGLTVTPRSTAAIEAAGQGSFGAASSVVTVARMVGMAIGLAILTAYGSTTIDRLSAQVYATPDAYLAYIPEALRDRPLRDPLVVEALESWASREAASIMVGLFLVAAAVTAVAVPPALALGASRRARPASSPGEARMLAGDDRREPDLVL
jgi:MFS family permease